MNSYGASYCTSFRKASCASGIFGFLANRKRASLLPLCFHLLDATPQIQAEPHTPGTQDSPPSRRCPKCGGPMRIIERFTAAELQLRSPPTVAAAAWSHSLQRENSACFNALPIFLILRHTD